MSESVGPFGEEISVEALVARYARGPHDGLLIREAIASTGTRRLIPDATGVVGRTASGAHTFDLSGRTITFKGSFNRVEAIPDLPLGTQEHPYQGAPYVALLLSGGRFIEPTGPRRPSPTARVCPTCNMALPATGVCDDCGAA